MAALQRRRKLEEQILREISDIVRREVNDPFVRTLTFTAVELSPDLGHARVYYAGNLVEKKGPDVAAGLTRASAFIRRSIGRRIRLHRVPDFHYFYDESIERGERLDRLIQRALSSPHSTKQE